MYCTVYRILVTGRSYTVDLGVARGGIEFGFALILKQNALIWHNWQIGAINNWYKGPVIKNSAVRRPDVALFGRLVQCPITVWVYRVKIFAGNIVHM
jgi:hypothetical protein